MVSEAKQTLQLYWQTAVPTRHNEKLDLRDTERSGKCSTRDYYFYSIVLVKSGNLFQHFSVSPVRDSPRQYRPLTQPPPLTQNAFLILLKIGQ